MFDINGWELIVLAMVAVVVLGPRNLPVYAAKLARAVRQVRTLAEGAQSTQGTARPRLRRCQLAAVRPRWHDPRRIVREALMDPAEPAAQAEARVWAPE